MKLNESQCGKFTTLRAAKNQATEGSYKVALLNTEAIPLWRVYKGGFSQHPGRHI